jgi:hypothetical protein
MNHNLPTEWNIWASQRIYLTPFICSCLGVPIYECSKQLMHQEVQNIPQKDKQKPLDLLVHIMQAS